MGFRKAGWGGGDGNEGGLRRGMVAVMDEYLFQ